MDRADHLDSTETARLVGDAAGEPSKIPTSIGKYRILSKLGEGGMGVVYEAEQQNPRRKVAVKVVRGGQFVDEQRVGVEVSIYRRPDGKVESTVMPDLWGTAPAPDPTSSNSLREAA